MTGGSLQLRILEQIMLLCILLRMVFCIDYKNENEHGYMLHTQSLQLNRTILFPYDIRAD